jgi:nucleotide-binding universal stress UspA family protein
MNEKLKMLIPTDFTVQAEFAYLMVKNLQSALPIEIHFLHVLPVPDTVSMDTAGNIKTCGEIDVNYVVKQRDIALRNLDNLRNIYGNDIHAHLQLGKVIDTVIRFAEEGHYDLVVMGTKGAWGLKEKLSGSETQMIARRTRIPLLSLMCDRSDLKIKNILMVHDFSHPANENLNLLHKLIKAFDARVHFLQITTGDPENEMSTAEGNMAEFATINKIEHYQCHLMKDADVESGVIHFNQMNEIDIICIGTQGKGGLFHHSATEKLINHLFKPILSFQLSNS